jgi:AraC-like DNA-binding protein/ligand-binding sensor protein
MEVRRKYVFEHLEEQLEMYYRCTGINVVQVAANGELISHHGRQVLYCAEYKRVIGVSCQCIDFFLKECKRATNYGEPYYATCPLNLLYIIVPLWMQNSFCGGLIAGPIILSNSYQEPDVYNLSADSTLDTTKGLLEFIRKIPLVDPLRTNYLGSLLYLITTTQSSTVLSKIKEKAQLECRINEQIQEVKESSIPKYDLRTREKMLQSYVTKGNYFKARAVLEELLALILLMEERDTDRLRTWCTEINSMISRAALDGGAPSQEILSFNVLLTEEIDNLRNTDEILSRMNKALYFYCESVPQMFERSITTPIKKAIEYINAHYEEDIRLIEVAEHAHLNASYFSQQFKKEIGLSFSEYVSGLRIEEGKELLVNTSQPILEIAVSLGFSSDSYFCRVFKKKIGKSPQKYRAGCGA